MILELYINGKFITRYSGGKNPNGAVGRLKRRYQHALLHNDWYIVEVRESRMNRPGFVVRS